MTGRRPQGGGGRSSGGLLCIFLLKIFLTSHSAQVKSRIVEGLIMKNFSELLEVHNSGNDAFVASLNSCQSNVVFKTYS